MSSHIGNVIDAELISNVTDLVLHEFYNAVEGYEPMNSAHEGYAIIKEELDELWDEVKQKKAIHDKQAMQEEAVQVAAMAIRFIVDVCMDKATSNSSGEQV